LTFGKVGLPESEIASSGANDNFAAHASLLSSRISLAIFMGTEIYFFSR
jgi:hypothetical protein